MQNLDLVKAVEHVELGQRDAVDAAGLDRLAHRDRVEPAAAPLASGDDAELAAALAERLADASLSSVGNGPLPTRVV